ncbi:MAG: EAL domain-containing protein [Planctomycetes bacterium]|nr:EAL domain-containing protein [Planctomycetota bacterium]
MHPKQILLVSGADPARATCIACLQEIEAATITPVDESRAVALAGSTQAECIVLVDGPDCDARSLLLKVRGMPSLTQTMVVAVAETPLLTTLASRGADATIATDAVPNSLRQVVEGVLRRREQWRDAAPSVAGKSILSQRLQDAIDAGELGSLLLLRFDQFANVSTALHTLGVAGSALHAELERSLRNRLTPLMPAGAWMSALSEETFVIAMPPGTPEADAVADRMVQSAREPLVLAERDIRLRVHAGWCPVDVREPADAATILGRAELADGEARSGAVPSAMRWSAAMESRLLNDLQLASAIQHAVERAEFQLMFQPQVGMVRGDVYGAEALIRWTLPTGLRIPPGRFVALAEECGLMDSITLWSLREACRQAAAWEQAGLHLRIAVNIAANQLANPRFVDAVRGALAESGVLAGQLAMEISEAAILSNPRAFGGPLKTLRNLGVTLCVDDFGVGVATLANLRTLPVSELKMDRSFIRTLPGTAQDRSVVQTMISLGRQLQLRMVAVGVESLAQWAWLKENGCDAAQGWLIGKATAGDGIPELVGKIRRDTPAGSAPRGERSELRR